MTADIVASSIEPLWKGRMPEAAPLEDEGEGDAVVVPVALAVDDGLPVPVAA